MHKIPNFNWMSVWQVQESKGSEGSAMSVKTPGWFLPTKRIHWSKQSKLRKFSAQPNAIKAPRALSRPLIHHFSHWWAGCEWDKWRRNHWGALGHDVLLPARFKAKGFNRPSFKGCTHNHSSFHNATLKPAPGSSSMQAMDPSVHWMTSVSAFLGFSISTLCWCLSSNSGSLDFNTVLKKYFRPAPVYWHSFPKGTCDCQLQSIFLKHSNKSSAALGSFRHWSPQHPKAHGVFVVSYHLGKK